MKLLWASVEWLYELIGHLCKQLGIPLPHSKYLKTRTKATETLWVFFGIHTAYALEIGRRIAREELQKAA